MDPGGTGEDRRREGEVGSPAGRVEKTEGVVGEDTAGAGNYSVFITQETKPKGA